MLGDDVFGPLDEFLAAGHEMRNMDTGEPLSTIRDRILSANAYIGAFPLAEALATGADVVIAGRCTDTALSLAPMIHASAGRRTIGTNWPLEQLPATLSNAARNAPAAIARWIGKRFPIWRTSAIPIIEAENDGTFSVTKHEGTGGRVSVDVVKEQLLYELGDPKNYIRPDCVADFTSIQLKDADRIGCKFRAFADGRAAGDAEAVDRLFVWLEGDRHAGIQRCRRRWRRRRAADRIVRERLQQLGLQFEEIYTEFFGVNACHGPVAFRIPIRPRCNCASACAGRIGRRSIDSRAS